MDIKVPPLGESIKDATVARWLKEVGAVVSVDEPLVELETDKITVEINAAASGVLVEIMAPTGSNVQVGTVIGRLEVGAVATTSSPPKESQPAPAPVAKGPLLSPAAAKMVAEQGRDPSSLVGTGKGGRVTKQDVVGGVAPVASPQDGLTQRVPMSRLRQRIAERLKESQQTAAILTTFNEIDMSHVMALRARYKEAFEKEHGVKLGFMSFFTKACLAALKKVPAVNAEIDGTDIVYKHYYNIGVAVGTDHGLVVPIVKNAESLSFAGLEQAINTLGQKARLGALSMDDLSGGTFTISNGGVYGSLLSTPILNPPQVGILGLHKIEERAVVVDKTIQIRPMMYVALSYDHRLIDGKEAVTFLVLVKDYMEDPERLLLDL